MTTRNLLPASQAQNRHVDRPHARGPTKMARGPELRRPAACWVLGRGGQEELWFRLGADPRPSER